MFVERAAKKDELVSSKPTTIVFKSNPRNVNSGGEWLKDTDRAGTVRKCTKLLLNTSVRASVLVSGVWIYSIQEFI